MLVCYRAQTTNSPPLPFLSCENQPQTQSRREDKLEKVPSFINQRTQRRRRYCEGRPYCLSLSLRRGRRARPHAEICPFVAHRVATLANFTHCNRLRDAIELMRLGRHLACYLAAFLASLVLTLGARAEIERLNLPPAGPAIKNNEGRGGRRVRRGRGRCSPPRCLELRLSSCSDANNILMPNTAFAEENYCQIWLCMHRMSDVNKSRGTQ